MRVVKYGRFYCVAGVVKLEKISSSQLVDKVLKTLDNTQFINPEVPFDWDVFDAALVNALLVYGTPRQRARTIPNEVLLRLAATTQLEEAIRRVGVREGLDAAVFLTVSDSINEALDTASKIVELTGKLTDLPNRAGKTEDMIRFYGLDERQLAAVQADSREQAVKMLVIQRMASTIL